jgi:PERQ amino acid-rich with GYF domain-containing protein
MVMYHHNICKEEPPADRSVVDEFVQTLLLLPLETEIISDSVYAHSQTLDGRRFAEEFVRRRKLADKGIVDPASNGITPTSATDNKSGGGWSEVAKKGPASAPKEDTNSAYKVVAPKKKGKR